MTLILNDVSEHQKRIDWPAHRAGRQAVILRAHNGNRADTLFPENRAGAAPMRLVGLYQYLVESRDAAEQAREFVATVRSLGANEWPILDIEVGSNYAARARAWLAVVEPALGRRAWVYSGDSYWRTTDLAAAVGDRCRWVARYSTTAPVTPHTLWQRSSSARAPGVAGAVDESVYAGTLDQLIALAIGDTDDMTPEDLNRALGGPANLTVWQKIRQMAAEGVKDALATPQGKAAIAAALPVEKVTAAVTAAVGKLNVTGVDPTVLAHAVVAELGTVLAGKEV